MSSIEDHRTFYAKLIVESCGTTDERLVAAFERVPREGFLGSGPWRVCATPGRYVTTPSDDPRFLYQDILVGLVPERGINNGQPSLHAACLAACKPRAGETAVHVGAGTGYYTAVLAELVGSAGRVVAYEIEADLARRATTNLEPWRNVEVRAASAVTGPLPPADVVYVNAGATHPVPAWLDALAVGGRLMFPLTADDGRGCMLLVTRRGTARYEAKAPMRCGFIPCVGARDFSSSVSLASALDSRPLETIRSLRRDEPPDTSVWCKGPGWWLSTADIGG